MFYFLLIIADGYVNPLVVLIVQIKLSGLKPNKSGRYGLPGLEIMRFNRYQPALVSIGKRLQEFTPFVMRNNWSAHICSRLSCFGYFAERFPS